MCKFGHITEGKTLCWPTLMICKRKVFEPPFLGVFPATFFCEQFNHTNTKALPFDNLEVRLFFNTARRKN